MRILRIISRHARRGRGVQTPNVNSSTVSQLPEDQPCDLKLKSFSPFSRHDCSAQNWPIFRAIVLRARTLFVVPTIEVPELEPKSDHRKILIYSLISCLLNNFLLDSGMHSFVLQKMVFFLYTWKMENWISVLVSELAVC